MRSLSGGTSRFMDLSTGRLAVAREKAPQNPVYFRVIYQTHVSSTDVDYLPLKHLSFLGNDQIVAPVN
jgi:hypothetical protein